MGDQPRDLELIDFEAVEDAVRGLLALGWTIRSARVLKSRFGVSLDRLEEIRDKVVTEKTLWLERATVPRKLAEHLLKVEGARQIAMQRQDMGNVVKMLWLEARLLGLDKSELNVNVREIETVSAEELLERRRRVAEMIGGLALEPPPVKH